MAMRPRSGQVAEIQRLQQPRQILVVEELDHDPPHLALAVGQEARRRQQARQGGSNAELEAGQLNEQVRAEPEATRFLNTAASRLGWSGRSLHRVLRVARPIADLAEADTLGVIHVAEAIQLRRALPGR